MPLVETSRFERRVGDRIELSAEFPVQRDQHGRRNG